MPPLNPCERFPSSITWPLHSIAG